MIDHPDHVERLLERLNGALPIPARVTPELLATLRQQGGTEIPTTCNVTSISYAGDEGGIVCRLDTGAVTGTTNAVFTSITLLRFDPRLTITREIVAYQKRRGKLLRQQPR